MRGGGKVDVIVVGAGVSGLEAARRLDQAGLNVVIVEARPRAGGRIDTRRPAGWPTPIEAGAEFVHGMPSILMQRLRKGGAHLVEVHAKHEMVQRGRVRSANRDWRSALDWMGRMPDEDVAFDTVLARDAALTGSAARPAPGPAIRRLMRNFVEGFNAADAASVSTSSLHEQTETSEAEHGDRMFRVRDGYDVLVDSLAAPLLAKGRLLLGLAVTNVRRRRDRVEVIAKSALAGHMTRQRTKLRARVVLLTVPLGILQARRGTPGAIAFDPPLPAGKRAAIARLAMGRVVKVMVRFRGPIGSGPLSRIPRSATFLHLPRAAVPTWWVPLPAPPSCLVGWVAGPGADRFAARHEGDLARILAAVGSLARGLAIRPGELEAFVEDALVVDWGRDPWTRGAYSWVPQGAVGANAALAAPVDDRLFFAGEATNTAGNLGTVHGALETAARAAAEISKRLAHKQHQRK